MAGLAPTNNFQIYFYFLFVGALSALHRRQRRDFWEFSVFGKMTVTVFNVTFKMPKGGR